MKKHDNDINKEKKITKIYLVYNINGIINRVYIGKEKSHKKGKRENDHRYKFGKEIIFKYIDQCDGWEFKNWEPLETKWIGWFIKNNYEVVNTKKKGGNGPGDFTKEIRNKISKSLLKFYEVHSHPFKGKKQSKETCLKKSLKAKGKPKPEGFGLKISKANKGKKQTIKTINQRVKLINKPILQYDLQGNFIKEYCSAKSASEKLKVHASSICFCLRRRQKTAYGFKWKYKNVKK